MNRFALTLLIALSLVATHGAYAHILAYDDLDAPVGVLDDVTTGSGWASGGWSVQNGDPRFTVSNFAMLSYMSGGVILETNGNFAHSMDAYRSAGRGFDISSWDLNYGPFTNFLKDRALMPIAGNRHKIGKEGTNLWISFLARRDADRAYKVRLHSSHIPHATANPFAEARVSGGTWELSATDTNGVDYLDTTTNQSVVGVTDFMVLHYTFEVGADVVDLFINPPLLGPVPTTPSASVTVTNDIYFQCLRIHFGNSGVQDGSIDEIRVGTTYADVTPYVVPEPAAAVAAVFALLLAARRR